MPTWLNLATISGAVTIVAFVAEVIKVFPKFAELRRGFLLISFGFFVGSLLTATSGSIIVLSPDGSPLVLLMTICVILVLLFLFLAVISETQVRKTEFYGLMAVFVAGFFLLLLIHGLSSERGQTMYLGELSFREKVWLGERALSIGDDERAIEVLQDAAADLTTGDPRSTILAQKIDFAKQRQMQEDLEAVR